MIFVSYSHFDEQWLKAFLRMAAPLRRNGTIRTFSDKDIQAGDSWRADIDEALKRATIAVLLVSAHFLDSSFVMDVELPYLFEAREKRGLRIFWILLSACLFEETPLKNIEAPLSIALPLDAMTTPESNASLKAVCQKIAQALKPTEAPVLNKSLSGRTVPKKAENLPILAYPVRRRVEIFARPDSTDDWYHQGCILPGSLTRTCYFGNDATKPGTGYHIIAVTTESPIPDQGGKPTKPLPKIITKSEEIRVVRV